MEWRSRFLHPLYAMRQLLIGFTAQVHPWRLPVTGLWLDVFQKIKALGYNCVSFYTHWGLIEYKRGQFKTDDFLSLDPFFEAAKKAGVYLIARPGPYINAGKYSPRLYNGCILNSNRNYWRRISWLGCRSTWTMENL